MVSGSNEGRYGNVNQLLQEDVDLIKMRQRLLGAATKDENGMYVLPPLFKESYSKYLRRSNRHIELLATAINRQEEGPMKKHLWEVSRWWKGNEGQELRGERVIFTE